MKGGIQDYRGSGKEEMGYRKGEFRTGGMRNRKYTERKEGKTYGMQDRRNVGLDGCMTGGM